VKPWKGSFVWRVHYWRFTVLTFRECDSIFHSGMAKEIVNLPYWCIISIMAKEAAKTQSKNADQLIPPSSSQKYLQIYLWVHRSWETECWKSWISSPPFYFLSFFFFIQNSWLAYLTNKTSYWATSQTKWYHCLRSTPFHPICQQTGKSSSYH